MSRRASRETALIPAVSLALALIIVVAPSALPRAVSSTLPERPASSTSITLPSSIITTSEDFALAPAWTQEALGELPLAFYDAVIPGLLSADDVKVSVGFETATPLAAKTGLYLEPNVGASPVAWLASTTVESATALGVFGRYGDWLLVGTPSRAVLPSVNGGTAPSSTFAWVRGADFTVSQVDAAVVVDTSLSTITIIGRDGAIRASEPATLGTDGVPTPVGTMTYIQATYRDPTGQQFTEGHPIILTGAHSATLDEYNGNAGLTGIHYSNASSPFSKGCVRVSAAMTEALAALPTGTPVEFR